MQREQNSFDALRLFGSILVIVGHAYVLAGHPAPQFAGIEIHTLGVKMFFIISGFLITASFLRDPNLIRFATRRALRILPALIAVILLTVALLAFVTTADVATYLAGVPIYIARNVMLLPYHVLPGVFTENPHPNAVNGNLWTLPVEVFMYAMTPLIVMTRSRIVILVAAAALLVMPVTVTVFGFGLAGASGVIPYFLLGAFVKLSRIPMPSSSALASLAVLTLASFITLPEIVIAAPLAVVVLYAAHSWACHLPADVSYGLYLVGFPIQQVLVQVGLSPLALIAGTMLIATPIALLSWHFIEVPALRRSRPVALSAMGASSAPGTPRP